MVIIKSAPNSARRILLSNRPTKLVPNDIKQYQSQQGHMVDLQGNVPLPYMAAAHEVYDELPDTFQKELHGRGLSIQLAQQADPYAKDFLKEHKLNKFIPHSKQNYPGAFYVYHPTTPFIHKFIPENTESIEANVPQFKNHIRHELGHSLHHIIEDFGKIRPLDELEHIKRHKNNALQSIRSFGQTREKPILYDRLLGNTAYNPVKDWHEENFADFTKFMLPHLAQYKHLPFEEALNKFTDKIWAKKYPWSTKNYLNALLSLHGALGGKIPPKLFYYNIHSPNHPPDKIVLL